MGVDALIAFFLAEFEGRANQLECGARFAEFLANGEPLQLREVREEAKAQASDRFIAHIGEQMRGRQIVAVIFLVIGAFLLAHINHVPYGGDAHHVFEGSGDGHADFPPGGAGLVGIV